MSVKTVDGVEMPLTQAEIDEHEAMKIAHADQRANPALEILEPYQFYAALEITGNKTEFEAAWQTILTSLDATGKIVAQAKLDHTKQFRPDNDLVLAMKTAMGLTDKQFKDLWKIGEGIV